MLFLERRSAALLSALRLEQKDPGRDQNDGQCSHPGEGFLEHEKPHEEARAVDVPPMMSEVTRNPCS